MLTFYNWRVKRSGAALRIIGKAIGTPENPTLSVDGYKISNVGSIDFTELGITAKDRTGTVVAILHGTQL